MPANLHHLKSLIVDSPRHGKDKIGRIPAGQDIGPPPQDEDAPQYTPGPTNTPLSHEPPYTPQINASLSQKNIPATWQGALSSVRPPVPPKDNQLLSSAATSHASQFPSGADGHSISARPYHPGRTLSITSVNSLSRLSFSSQIKQLVLIQLPDASSLSNAISSISTAPKVARTLDDAGHKIQLWITKGADVLEGLDAGGDAEWAAAAGRDGLSEVDTAIFRFENLIQVYIAAVENLHARDDISLVADGELQLIAHQVERIASDWRTIKNNLQTIKKQVEFAMEWEGIRDSVFQDIGAEIEVLRRQIFEMEEQRHVASLSGGTNDSAVGVDISELETIVEEAPSDPNRLLISKLRTSPAFNPAPISGAQDDAKLLGLFARMQPLRALLDFLPMRLSSFQGRAKAIFPMACQDLDDIQESMSESFVRLESDAESLRRELGEDRWVLVFRNAGRQAQKMIDSVGRSIAKLDESLESNTALRHAPGTLKKIENYEAKKTHYCPAVERVLAIVERGVRERLTVNGEILRLQHELQSRWQTTKTDIKNMDSTLDSYEHFNTKQLRDSISSIMSSDPSFLSSVIETPGDSSSASSIHTPDRRMSDVGTHYETRAPFLNGKPRQQSSSSTSSRPSLHLSSSERRFASSPLTLPSQSRLPQPRKTPLNRISPTDLQDRRSVSLSPGYQALNSRAAARISSVSRSAPSAPQNNRPRWNSSYTPPKMFAYDHPHPGQTTGKADSSRRPTSSLANPSMRPASTSQSSHRSTATSNHFRVSRPPSSLLATPSPVPLQRTPRSAPAGSTIGPSSSTSRQLRTSRSSINSSIAQDQDPTSPSPSHTTLTNRHSLESSATRSASATGKRRSFLPLPAVGKENSVDDQMSPHPLNKRPMSRLRAGNNTLQLDNR